MVNVAQIVQTQSLNLMQQPSEFKMQLNEQIHTAPSQQQSLI